MSSRRAPGIGSTDTRPVVRIGEPGELAAAVPQLLGFHPAESLVLISLHGPRNRVQLTARIDLRPEWDAAARASSAVEAMLRNDPSAVLAVVLSEVGAEAELPHRALVGVVTAALAEGGTGLREALLVRAGRWWSYECPDRCCLPDAGTALPGGVSALAAASVAAGVVVARDRAELQDRVAGVATAEQQEACRRAAQRRWLRAAEVGWAVVAADARVAVQTALGRYAPLGSLTRTAVPDAQLAEVVWGLRDTEVRDWALQLCLGADAAAAEALWTDCTRRAPAPLDAAPATLLAVSAWLRGDGATANVALERALAGDPGYALAGLLRQALAQCVPPARLRALLAAPLPGTSS